MALIGLTKTDIQPVARGPLGVGIEFLRAFENRPEGATLCWIDLHLDDQSQDYDKDGDLPAARPHSDGVSRIRIPPRHCVDLWTKERVSCGTRLTGLVMPCKSVSKRGLLVMPGKIDPGFTPRELVIVAYNPGPAAVDLKVGDPVVAVAFAETQPECTAYKGVGHAKPRQRSNSAVRRLFDEFVNAQTGVALLAAAVMTAPAYVDTFGPRAVALFIAIVLVVLLASAAKVVFR